MTARDEMFRQLEVERGKPVSYRTFWNWCQILGVLPGEPFYSFDDVLILKTYCWLRNRKLRNIDRNLALSQQLSYLSQKGNYDDCKYYTDRILREDLDEKSKEKSTSNVSAFPNFPTNRNHVKDMLS